MTSSTGLKNQQTDPSERRAGATARLGRHDVHEGFGGIGELLNEHRTGHTAGRKKVNPERPKKSN